MAPLRNVPWAALCVAFACSSVSGGEPLHDRQLNDYLDSVRKRYDLPGIAAAVVSSKGVERIGSAGVRKRGSAAAITANDRFHLGSNGKALTAALLGRLVDEKKLAWDLTVADAFPELKKSMADQVGTITLKQLLTHTSGLQGDPKVGWWSFEKRGSIRQRRMRVVRWAVGQKLHARPGARFEYSNLGYTLAAAMAERKLNQSWEQLIRKRVFEPLKMTSSGFGPPGSARTANQPWPHTEKGEPLRPGPLADNPPVVGPAGRIHCSLPDWSRFLADQLKGANGRPGILQTATYQQLHSTTVANIPYTIGAWDHIKSRRGTILAHDGSNSVNYSTALMLPKVDAAIIVVCNQGGTDAQKACGEILEKLLRGRLRKR